MATFTGTDADEIITPETVSATVTASDGAAPSTLADVIYGGGGGDIVAGGGGNDIVDLGAGDDRFIWDPGEGSDTVDGGTGVDTLQVSGSAASELVEISASGGDARLFRNVGSITLSLRDIEHIDYAARDGQDAIGVNDLTGTSVRRVSLDLSASTGGTAGDGETDAVTVSGSATGDTILIEGDGNLVTVGGLPAEVTVTNPDGDLDRLVLNGGGGADAIDARKLAAGAIVLTIGGGTGDDFLFGSAGDDVLEGGAGIDFMDGGAGIDTASYANAAAGVVVNLQSGRGAGGEANGDYLVDIENIIGSAFSDTLTGNAADNVFRPGASADVIYGGNGSDTVDYSDAGGAMVVNLAVERGNRLGDDQVFDRLVGIENVIGSAFDDRLTGGVLANVFEGGAGADRIDGGEGIDTASYASSSESVTLNLAGGIGPDGIGRGGHAEGDLLIGIENLTGSAFADSLTGDAGDNRLDGGGGGDRMAGGAGSDIYVVDDAGDAVIEEANGGLDRVQSSITYTLPANVEILVLTGKESIDADGNVLNNQIVGNAAANILDGKGGADRMEGGNGDDTYIVDDSQDDVVEQASGGVDSVRASVDSVLEDWVENLILTGSAISGSGNELDNRIVGNAAHNRIDGGRGADTMIGGAGDDGYVVDNAGDEVIEASGEGVDTVYALVDYALGAHVENLELVKRATAGTGNELANTLSGNALDNSLDGGAGRDTLIGGAGNDTYVVDNAGDVVVELANDGVDTVRSSVNWILAIDVENLNLTSDKAINGTGNTLANVLRGNQGDNVLDGGSGADTMIGGGGNDTYLVDNAGDVVSEKPGNGDDTVRSAISHTLGGDVERLVLTGNAAIAGTGNGLDNTIIGNAAANILSGAGGDDRLDGGGGADTMIGGKGNDTYTVDSADDVVSESGNGGTDTVVSSVAIVLAAEVEHLRLIGGVDMSSNAKTSVSGLNGTGNGLANQITGSAVANLIDGGAGNDLIRGESGNDRLVGGAGKDVLSGGFGKDILVGGKGNDSFLFDDILGRSHADRISDFRHGRDKIVLDGETFGDLGAGKLGKKAFLAGKAAADEGDRVIYDQERGRVFFDTDGKGGAGKVLFAKLGHQPELTSSDFLVV